MSDRDSVIKSVQTALRIVEQLQTVDVIGITELAEEIDQSPATTYNHLSTLHEEAYVTKTEDKRY